MSNTWRGTWFHPTSLHSPGAALGQDGLNRAPAKPKLNSPPWQGVSQGSTVLGPWNPSIGDSFKKVSLGLPEGDKHEERGERKPYLGSAGPWGLAGAPCLHGPLTASPSLSSGCSGGHPTCPSHAWTPLAARVDNKAGSARGCPTLCDPIDGSPPGFPVPGILQARTLEWVSISFSNA